MPGSVDVIMQLLYENNLPAFRFNVDAFNQYIFDWQNDEFIIQDPSGRICKSEDLTGIAAYHSRMTIDQNFENEKYYAPETAWVISWINHLHDAIIDYAKRHDLIRLWTPHSVGLSKVYQMNIAKKYFKVPEFRIFWNKELQSKKVIEKPLTARPFLSGGCAFSQIVDQADLDSKWPWFTQEIADGNRDATVLYINGKIHCYQFATERGDLTDWRIAQGTERNKWISWNAGKEFEKKVDLYMKDMKLKYGRLDFIIGGKEPQFLEVNQAGQFGWLDDENLTLHNEVVAAILDPSSTIIL